MRSLLVLGLLACVTPAGAVWDPVTGTITNERWASGLPLGAPGHGFIEFGTDGSFGGLTTQHNPTRPTGLLKGAFVAVACDGVGRILRRPLPEEYDNVQTIATTKATMEFPRGTIRYEDPDWPLETTLAALTPSFAAPVVVLRLTLTNRSATSRLVRVAFAWPNTIGFGAAGDQQFHLAARRGVQPTRDGLRYIAGETARPDDVRGNALGEYYVTSAGLSQVEALTGWDDAETSLSWWRPFVEGLAPPAGRGPSGALAGWCDVPAGRTATVDFALAWSFPQRWVTYQRLQDGPVNADRREAEAAIDGDPSTRWTTSRPMLPNDELTVFLAQPTEVGAIELDWHGSPADWPRGLVVGERQPRAEKRPAYELVPFSMLDPLQVQDLAPAGRLRLAFKPERIQSLTLGQLGWSGKWWWSIHEVRVFDTSRRPVRLTGAEARLASAERVELGQNEALTGPGGAEELARVCVRRVFEEIAVTRHWQSLLTSSSLPTWLQRKLLNDAAVLPRSNQTGGAEIAARVSWLFTGLPPGTREQAAVGAPPDLPWSLSSALVDAFWPGLSNGSYDALMYQPDPNELGPRAGETADLRVPTGVLAGCLAGKLAGRVDHLAFCSPATRAIALLRTPDIGHDLPNGYRLGLLAVGWAVAEKLDLDHTRAAPARQAWIDYIRQADYASWDVRDAAGIWLARSVGLEPPLPEPERSLLLKQLIARCQQPFWPVPAGRVDADGQPVGESVDLPALQAQLGAAAIAEGFVADGLDTLERANTVAWDLNHNPWAQPVAYQSPRGGEVGPLSDLSAGASWQALAALTGLGADGDDALRIAPRLLPGRERVRLPFFLPQLRGQLEYAPAARRLRLHVLNGRTAAPLRRVRGADGTVIELPQPVELKPGAVVNLDPWCDILRPKHDLREVGFTVGRKSTRSWGYPANRWRARVIGDDLPTDSRLDAPLAFDGDRATHWSTLRPMEVGDAFELDLGEVLRVGRVDVDPGDARREFPRGLRVEVSTDGMHWRELTGVEVLTADDGSVRATFPAVRARQLRLTNLGTATGLPWSIAEVYVLP